MNYVGRSLAGCFLLATTWLGCNALIDLDPGILDEGSVSASGSVGASGSVSASASGTSSGGGGCGAGGCGGGGSAECTDETWVQWPPEAAKNYSTTSETVVDLVTNLMWQRKAHIDKLSWTDAKKYCDSLDLGGYVWRLPTRVELVSIVSYDSTAPSIDLTTFPATPLDAFWSASPLAGAAGSAWSVYFNDGYVLPNSTGKLIYVRCVRRAS